MSMPFPVELWDSDADRVAILRAACEAHSGAIVVIDRLGNSVFFNEAAESLWQDRAEALLNRSAISLLGLDSDHGSAGRFARALEQLERWEEPGRISAEDLGEPAAVAAARSSRRLPGAKSSSTGKRRAVTLRVRVVKSPAPSASPARRLAGASAGPRVLGAVIEVTLANRSVAKRKGGNGR